MIIDLPVAPITRPPDEECRCGRVYSWEWWDPPARYAHMEGRWCAPHIDPCEICGQVGKDLQASVDHERRCVEAGIPSSLRGWSLTRLLLQGPQEVDDRWMEWVKRQHGKYIGVLRVNAVSILAARDWSPAHGAWLWVSGEVGRGKSVLAAAIAADLLRVTPMVAAPTEGREVPGPGSLTYSSKRGWGACFIGEAELMRRQRLAWKGDPHPLYRVSQAGVLVLDDLGTSQRDNGSMPSVVLDAIEQLVCYRYEHELPTVITSNLTWSEVTEGDLYGARVASRLRERTSDVLTLGGPSWRDV